LPDQQTLTSAQTLASYHLLDFHIPSSPAPVIFNSNPVLLTKPTWKNSTSKY
jgi:hypothetical protein